MNQQQRANKLRKFLIDRAKSLGVKSVGVPLSGGVDSHTALFATLEAGLKPHVYSFHMDGIDSRDVRTAQRTAEHFNLPFTKVTLPSDIATLRKDVVRLAKAGCVSKTEFECFWPMLYLMPAIKQKAFFTGHGADRLYCLSRKANQHFKGRWDEFRQERFDSPKSSQRHLIEAWCEKHNKVYCPIFSDVRILKIFQGTTPDDINKPVQKAISRFAFPEYYEQIRVYNHQSFQLGDSGIKVHFENLLDDSELNAKGYKSVVGIYNELVRKYGG